MEPHGYNFVFFTNVASATFTRNAKDTVPSLVDLFPALFSLVKS
jgi:hypothetical protein